MVFGSPSRPANRQSGGLAPVFHSKSLASEHIPEGPSELAQLCFGRSPPRASPDHSGRQRRPRGAASGDSKGGRRHGHRHFSGDRLRRCGGAARVGTASFEEGGGAVGGPLRGAGTDGPGARPQLRGQRGLRGRQLVGGRGRRRCVERSPLRRPPLGRAPLLRRGPLQWGPLLRRPLVVRVVVRVLVRRGRMRRRQLTRGSRAPDASGRADRVTAGIRPGGHPVHAPHVSTGPTIPSPEGARGRVLTALCVRRALIAASWRGARLPSQHSRRTR